MNLNQIFPNDRVSIFTFGFVGGIIGMWLYDKIYVSIVGGAVLCCWIFYKLNYAPKVQD